MASDLQKQFGEDATALVELLTSPGPLRPSNVRVVAAALVRKWLLDGNLNLLAKELGDSVGLPVVNTTKVVLEIGSDPGITFFLAGGVQLDGELLHSFYVSDAPYEGKAAISGGDLSFLRLHHFLKSPRIFYQGDWFTAEQVIKFVANKYGGVHFDLSRQHDWQTRLEAAAKCF